MERESIEMDVLFVGAGPASLSGALHLSRLVKEHNEAVAKGTRQGRALGDIEIAVIEKGASIGSHILSGAVMDPKALKEDRKSTRLNSSHANISYAVFCLKKKKKN